MPKKEHKHEVVMGDDPKARAKYQKQVDKVKAKAAKDLLKSPSGFALMYLMQDKKGKTTGVQQVVAGALGIAETVQLIQALKHAAEHLQEGLMQGLAQYEEGHPEDAGLEQ